MLGKQKVGLLGFEFRGWLGGNLSDGEIQVVGSSWAKKNDYVETEKGHPRKARISFFRVTKLKIFIGEISCGLYFCTV